MGAFDRIIVVVLDSVGLGALPDAADFGDAGSDTLGHVAASRPLRLPRMARLGLGNIRPLEHIPAADPPGGFCGKAALASRGKDTTSGHWEMMGLVLSKPFPTYLQGFPWEVIGPFQEAIGRRVLGNRAASGTEIIQELGEEHLRTGSPIVYTSADSVFQVAAHEDVIPVEELYRICGIARGQLQGEHQVGRVIARPFTGSAGAFRRTRRRRDFAIPPFVPTVLDHLTDAQVPICTVGKIASVFCYRGTGVELQAKSNQESTLRTLEALDSFPRGFIFVNFVDFDQLYGHRNDVEGYARSLEEFDADLGRIQDSLRQGDLLVLTSDHGCDPATASTDHSREYALLLCQIPGRQRGTHLGTRGSLADIGATVAENFGVAAPAGESFLGRLTEG